MRSRFPGSIPQRGAAPPAERADVVLVGVGGVGGFIAPVLARAGLQGRRVWRPGRGWRLEDFQPDELGSYLLLPGRDGGEVQERDAALAPQ